MLGARHEAGHAEHPHADAGARADDRREERSGHARSPPAPTRCAAISGEPPCGGKRRSIDRSSLRHVEQHVDGDDDDQDEREEQLDDPERSALGERDEVLRVAGDLPRPRASRAGPSPARGSGSVQPVGVEPALQPVDVALGVGPIALSALVRKVGIDPVRGRAAPARRRPSRARRGRRSSQRRMRGTRRRRRSHAAPQPRQIARTSGSSRNAISDATRNRKSA